MKPHFQTLIAIVLLLLSKLDSAESAPPIARAGCQDTCGNVSIPYPWGIGPQCFLDSWFEISCNSTKPFLSKFDAEVVEIVVIGSDDGVSQHPHITLRLPPLNICSTANTQHHKLNSIDLKGGPYVFSVRDNMFVMEGCAGSAILVDQSNATMGGCASVCGNNNTSMASNDCFGVNCCQSPPTNPSPYYPFTSYRIDFNPQSSGGGQSCLLATLMQSDSLNQYVGRLSSSDQSGAAPVSLSWSWTSNVQPDLDPHATCLFDSYSNTSLCSCNQDSVGSNPYVSGGCQVAEECKSCHGDCYKTNNNLYSCYEKQPVLKVVAVLGLFVGIVLVALVMGCYGLYRLIKRRRKMKRTAKLFKRNGGLLLEQQLSSNTGVIERSKIFTSKELEKATDNFHENRILGQGGQGTVYKGMLSDGRIVAIKKSKLLDESQLEQFINEVVILSQINHRHVVKLLGCCLETEVPLLVYEFVASGTLFQHIHEPDEDLFMSWATRLKVATDSAGAIAYLHSSSSSPIYHRDIKSLNILLADKNRAKVSDFGSSKTIAIDQTHLSTLVQGTMGYLDPEYFQSYQFTEKRDVYSFGVVLLELLTSKKPIYRDENMEQKNLVPEFVLMMENSRLCDILDPKIVKEAKEEELMIVADLAKRCLNWKGRARPTMKEVAMTLEMIIRSPTEMSTEDQQTFPEWMVMPKISDSEFISGPVPSGYTSTK